MSAITDINWLFQKYFSDNPQLKRIVIIHSEQVAKKALKICSAKKLSLNPVDIYCAAFLHDIGVVMCDAPDIGAHGNLPYIRHGIEGRKILEQHGLFQYASICDTHTGSGITAEEIVKNNIPLPVKDYLPLTLLEKLICYSDKFFSKSHDLLHEKSIEEITSQMKKFGEDSLKRFLELHELFCISNQ